ncbi:50S ribosomal protein L13 [Candidatus Woesearchaeota archaeon]|nr:50S ribosomal protein L13 [Candidatus Woesearchaeota archaeon]
MLELWVKMDHIIIDAKDVVVGRLASYAAKQALLGKKVDIINCEQAIVTGNRKNLIEHYKQKVHRGNVFKGPFIGRSPDRLVRRIVRGMLPFKKSRGRNAFRNVMCYNKIPDSLKDAKAITLKEASISKLSSLNYMKIKELSRLL